MLPIVIYSIKYGVKWGLGASFVFALAQLGQAVQEGLFSWGLSVSMLIACIFFDYVIAYSLIGLSGLFRKYGFKGWIAGTIFALLARFLCHFLSGIVIWETAGKLWDGFSTDNSYLYSLVYNGSFMLPEILLTTVASVIILKLPQMKKLMQESA